MAMSDNAKGALLMCVSMGAFCINDGFMKENFETSPVAQTIFIRGLFASAILVAWAQATGALRFRPARHEIRPLVFRSIGEILGTASFMMALSHMPLANATAVLQGAPLAVTMAAALFLGEKVGWRRWSAIMVGFIGMLVMLRPGGADFDLYAIFAVFAVLFIVLRDLGTRGMSAATPTLYASAISAVCITVVSGLVIPFEGWKVPVGREALLAACSAAFIIVGYVTNVGSMRFGDVSAVSPFRYTVLIWALLIGYFGFGQVPDTMTLIGAAIVVAAGLYTLWREQIRGQDIGARSSARPFSPAQEEPEA
ncbi:DMT family transporter [Acuticoccus sp. MNP-M23]|uniref:DMT family transporter n=1 Tax=Acuticoccus sp. MNP-M23 TaxID=3072793 RepID=UPI0028154647|nr:DMT family transporter [Acuticoccus sp. MNP-M23]WMS44169.1 DMT family transporter [Acuticoccus sp. MNP-M23]